MKKSLVVGVHSGFAYLPYSLPSLAKLEDIEILFVLDRVARLQPYVHMIRKYCPDARRLVKLWKLWKYGPAETFNYGLSMAEGDLLYVSAEDIVLDPRNFDDGYWSSSQVGMVDFRYYQYDPLKYNFHVKWDMMLLRVSDKLGYGTARSGLYGIRRSVFEEVGGLKDSPTEEDWLRTDVIQHGYRHVHVKSTRNLHLRPSYDKQRQIMQGISRRKQGRSLQRVIAHSLLHFKPYVLKGYLQGETP